MDFFKDLPPEFGTSLTAAEETLLECAKSGAHLMLPGAVHKILPGEWEGWPAERTIRSTLIEWLCTNRRAIDEIHPRSIGIGGARIFGHINLEAIDIPFSLMFDYCAIPEGVSLLEARLKRLSFRGSHIGGILADGLRVDTSLFLDYVTSNRKISLIDASIEGQFAADEIHVNAVSECALNLRGINVKGSVLLRKAQLRVATNDNSQSKINEVYALALEQSEIGGSLSLTGGFAAEGTVSLSGSKIKGNVECDGASIQRPSQLSGSISSEYVLLSQGAHIEGSLLLRNGFSAIGTVNLGGMHIEGILDLSRAIITKPKGIALVADRITVGSGVVMREFKAEGQTVIAFSDIGRVLEAEGASLSEGTDADGKSCALNASRMNVHGTAAFVDGFCAYGEVRLEGAKIDGDLSCRNATLENAAGKAFNAQGMIVGGRFNWLPGVRPIGTVDLTNAAVQILCAEDMSWPEDYSVLINHFAYGSLGGNLFSVPHGEHLSWLRKVIAKQAKSTKNGEFWSQPYEQLALFYERHGHEKLAKEVHIARLADLRRFGRIGVRARIWNLIHQMLIGYGWKPFRAFWLYIVPLVICGCFFFHWSDAAGIMKPTPGSSRPRLDELSRNNSFNPVAYPLDTFFPFLNLHQEDSWYPSAATRLGAWHRIFLWIYIILGWALSAFFVAGITGLVRKT